MGKKMDDGEAAVTSGQWRERTACQAPAAAAASCRARACVSSPHILQARDEPVRPTSASGRRLAEPPWR